MKNVLLFCVSLCLVFTGWGQAKQRTQLSGTITDSKTGEPLAGASVLLTDTRTGTLSDTSGHYTLSNIPAGHALIEVSYAGYKTLVAHLDLAGNTVRDFALVSSIIENEGVTVTGVAGATSLRKAPIPISKVSHAELLATPSTNLIDALSHQPGISQLSTGPAVSKPIIRGLGYNRLVVINDGVRQEGQQWGDEHGIEIDENSVGRVEILKGPASLIYGSDAMAGVINFITTTPVQNNTVKGSVLSGYQTNNRQRTLFGTIGGNQNGFNWNVWGDYKAAADYRNRYDDRVFNSKFNEHNYGGYAGYNGRWGFSHLIISRFNQNLGLIEGARDSSGHFVKALPGGLEGRATNADFYSTTPQIPYQHIRHTKLIGDNSFTLGHGRLTLNLAWQRNERQEYGNADLPAAQSLYFDLNTVTYNTAYHFDDHQGWKTVIGINGMAQGNKNKGLEALIPAYRLFDAGGFIFSQKTIQKATFSGGLRYDHRVLTANELKEDNAVKFQGFTKRFANVSGSAGVSYAASETLLLKLNLARGFRAPSIPELASNGAHEGTNRYEYGNNKLQSETSWQGDLGVELQSDHVFFSASLFYNHIQHFIFYSKLLTTAGSDSLVPVAGKLIPAYQFGQHTATLAGAEVQVDWHPHPLDWLHWENTLSYVRGRFSKELEGTRNVPFIPATTWNSEVRAEWRPKGNTMRNLALHAGANHTFRQNHPFTAYETETATGSYTLLNAGISAEVVRRNKTLFSVFLLGSNLADVAYQSHLSRLKYVDVNLLSGRQGVFNTGRNFVVKINIPLAFATSK